MYNTTDPLNGVRVLSYGGIWAGRIAAMLLADQGAEVVEINRPGYAAGPEGPLLARGKFCLELDLKSPGGRQDALRLAADAHIVIDNLGTDRADRLGLGYASVAALNKAVVYASIPGFAKGDPREHLAAWEGSIDALLGVYTDIPPLGRLLGGAPKFTSIPMASAYAGVHASVAATLAFMHRINTGVGQHLETPLADSVFSAMALHAMDVGRQPARYDLPTIDKVMTEVAFPILRDLSTHLTAEHRAAIAAYLAKFTRPQAANYRCADGRMVFINASEHVFHTRACLETLGLLDGLIASGMILGSPYAERGEGNNLCDPASLTPHWQRCLSEAMSARFLTKSAQEWETLLRKAGVPAAVVRTTQEWLRHEPLQEAGIVATLADPERGGAMRQAGRFVSIEGAGARSPALRAFRGKRSHVWTTTLPLVPARAPGEGSKGILDGVRVLDLSNIIAAPAAGRVLAEFGADVVKVDAPNPQAGPRLTMWFGISVNEGKRALILDLKKAEGQAVLARMVRDADVVLHNFLDPSASTLGISHEQLKAIKPDIISCQLTAWGGPHGGPYKDDPAFDPVVQAASGITARYGTLDAPVHHGSPSCIDFITGFTAALGIAQALVARSLGRGGSHVHTSLAMGGQLIQFPFMVDGGSASRTPEPSGQDALGYGPHYRLYETQDGWSFFGCRPEDLRRAADALGARDASEQALAAVFAGSSLQDLQHRLTGIDAASIVPTRRLDALRRECLMEACSGAPRPEGSLKMTRAPHPSGHLTTLPLPTWYRLDATPVRQLTPAPLPGNDSRAILREIGLSETEIATLFEKEIVRAGWPVSKRYLPL